MLVRVKVKPGSKKFKIELKEDENGPYLSIWLKSQPKRDRANKELLKELNKIFGHVKIVSGRTSREKYIKVENNINLKDIIKIKKMKSRKNHHIHHSP